MDNNNPLPSTTRRLFLQRSLIAMAAVAATPVLGSQALTSTAVTSGQTPTLKILSSEEYRTLAAVTDAIIPQSGAFPIGALDIDLAARIDHHLKAELTDVVAGVSGALMFIENKAPEAFAGKTARFSDLETSERESILLAMRDAGGVPTIIFSAMRGLSIFYFYTHEDAWPHIGYDGPLVKRPNPVQQMGV
ncbi:MAG: gluconate 2-dehydrogenase subunit 3 family protein [Oceanospirillaceae bacterium]|nr:gluconate 2-dehydrogenase subunit 3 family protein [Oceanospirillaceae bacterium]